MVLVPVPEQSSQPSSNLQPQSGGVTAVKSPGELLPSHGDVQETFADGQPSIDRAEAATGRVEIGHGSIDSEAVTQEGVVPGSIFDELDEGFLSGGSDPLRNSWGAESRQPVETEIPGLARAFGEEAVHGEDALPPVAWQSASSARNRQIAAVVAIALTSFAIATIGFVLIVRSWKQSRQGGEIATLGPSDSLKGAEAQMEDSTDGNDAASSTIGTNGAPEVPTDLASESTELSPSPEDSGVENGVPAEKPSEVTSEEGSLPGGRSDLPSPDELFPNNLGVGEPNPPTVPAAEGMAGDEEGTATELPPELAQYVQQLQLSRPSEVAAKNPLSAPPTIEELKVRRPELEFSSSDYPLPQEKVDVRKLMGVKLIGADAKDQPLQELLLVISQLTACPIQYEWLGLEVAGIESNREVSVTEKDIEAGQLLRRVTDQAGARLGLSDGFVLIGPGSEANSAALLRAFDLSDLGNGEGLDPGGIRLLIGSVPGDLKVSIEPPMLLIEGSDQAKWRAALIVEAIRRARKVPTKLSDTLSRWLVEVVDFQVEEGLGFAQWRPLPTDPVNIDSHQAEPVEWILHHLANSRASTLVFDWASAWERGLTPSAKVLPWYRGRGIDAVAAEILEPYGMKAWDAGEGTWWVSTEESYLDMPLVLLLDGGSAEQRAQIEEVVIGAAGQAVGASSVWRDPISGKLVAVLPRYVIQEIPRTLRSALAK